MFAENNTKVLTYSLVSRPDNHLTVKRDKVTFQPIRRQLPWFIEASAVKARCSL